MSSGEDGERCENVVRKVADSNEEHETEQAQQQPKQKLVAPQTQYLSREGACSQATGANEEMKTLEARQVQYIDNVGRASDATRSPRERETDPQS